MFYKISYKPLNLQFKIIQQFALLLFITLSIHISSTASQAADAEPATEIQYTDTGSDELIGYIYSKPRGGVICNKCLAVELKIDGNDIPAEIKPAEVGKLKIASRYSGLEDGPHTVTKKLTDKEGNVLSSNQAIFFVDTKPPVLELVEPSKDTLLPGQKSFIVKFSDEGSGIPSIAKEMKVEAKVNGVDAQIYVSEKNNSRMLIIDDLTGIWKPGEKVNLYIKIKDRARNKAELNKKFRVHEKGEERKKEPVKCSKDGETTISQMAHTIIVPWPEIDINSTYFYKNKKKHKIEFDLYTSLGYQVKNSILKRFKITSNHPAISVQRLSSPKGSREIRYIISQSGSVTSYDSLGSITISHPKKIIHKFENSCKNGNPFSKFIEMESSSDVITYSVPVSLFWFEKFHDEVAIEEERFKYKVFFDKPGRLDIAASRFEIEDRPYWFKDAQEYYEVDLPAREGLQAYKVELSLSSGIWGNTIEGELTNNKTCLKKYGDIFVKLEPPMIENFFYDHSKEQFWAVIQDKGTELKKLKILLNVTEKSGIRKVATDLNFVSGAMKADYPLPTGIESAAIAVTDKAGQTTHVTCDVFGTPPKPESVSEKEKLLPLMSGAIAQKAHQPLIESRLELKKVLELFSSGKEKELERLLTENVPIDLLAKDTVSITLKERDDLNRLITDYAYSGKGSPRLRFFIGYFLFYSERRDWLAANVLSNNVEDASKPEQQDAYMKLGKLYERMGQEDRAVSEYLKATYAGLPMAEVAPYLARIYGVPLEDITSDLPSATATPDEKQDRTHPSVSAKGLSSGTIGK